MGRTVGAFIFPTVWEQWDTNKAARIIQQLQDFGVNTLATESETYRHDLIELAHRLGLKVVGGISCFSEHGRNHQQLYERPELWPVLEDGSRRPLMEWYIGVTPTFDDYNARRLDILEKIMREYELDGMILDFVRWPLHWELELRPGATRPAQSSFDPHTIAQFLEYANLEIPADVRSIAEQAQWILQGHRAVWTDFKCHVIAHFVGQARERVKHWRPETGLGAYMVAMPDEERAYWVGQRVRDLSPVVDFFAPMVYHPVLHQTAQWGIQTIEEITALAPGRVLPVLQVDSAEGAAMGSDWGPPVPVEDWHTVACAAASRSDTLGLAAFTGTALFADGRGEVLARCLQDSAANN
jgi:hypothetical protein